MHIVRNWQMTVNSSATRGGTTYRFDNASARWEANTLFSDPPVFNVVREPDYCGRDRNVSGRAPEAIGQVKFDGPVIIDTNGPSLVVDFGNGRQRPTPYSGAGSRRTLLSPRPPGTIGARRAP